MKTIIISLMTMLLSCCKGQNNNSNVNQHKARIKFETILGLDSAEKNGERAKDTLTSKGVFKYDDKGNLIEANYYNLKTNSIFSRDKRVYDESGNMVEITFYNKIGGIDGKDIYKYDDKNHQIQKENYWKGKLKGKLTRVYDYNKMIVTESTFDENGKLETQWSYKIDERENHLEEYDSDRNITSKSTFIYDKKGNIIKEHSEAWEMDTTNLEINTQYDNFNNEIMRTITDLKNNNQVSTVKTKYVYDENGNWTTKIITWSWLPNRQTIKREIEYYDK